MPPKGIGYQDASKLSAFRRKKSKDEAALKKKSKFNRATERVIQGYIDSGFTREEAIKKVDKGARERAAKGGKEF